MLLVWIFCLLFCLSLELYHTGRNYKVFPSKTNFRTQLEQFKHFNLAHDLNLWKWFSLIKEVSRYWMLWISVFLHPAEKIHLNLSASCYSRLESMWKIMSSRGQKNIWETSQNYSLIVVARHTKYINRR